MNQLFSDYFADMDSFIVIPPGQQKVMDKNYKKNLINQALETVRQLNCDAALLMSITRFRNRLGHAYSANQPASVAFDYKHISSQGGHVICSSSFDESQESLFENLLSFSGAIQRKFKWITATDLAKEGLQKSFTKCSHLQHP